MAKARAVENLGKILDAIPGLVSIISLNLDYLVVNEKLANFFGLERSQLEGQPVGNKCSDNTHAKVMLELSNSPIGTEKAWEYQYQDCWLLVVSRREEDHIINHATDISDRKLLEAELRASEERNLALIKAIPAAVKSASGRRSTEQFENFIDSLIESPIITPGLSQTESLIRLEVQSRENSARILQIEKSIFQDGALSILSRIRALEVQQESDAQAWKDLKSDRDKIDALARVSGLVASVPGGIKTWAIIIVLIQITGILLIDLAIRRIGIDKSINVIERNILPK